MGLCEGEHAQQVREVQGRGDFSRTGGLAVTRLQESLASPADGQKEPDVQDRTTEVHKIKTTDRLRSTSKG